jgi:ankyrin repeat protein
MRIAFSSAWLRQFDRFASKNSRRYSQSSSTRFAESRLVVGWRPEIPEEAVLSSCSSLISVIDDKGSKVAQFSHFSVKEYLVSDRLRTSDVRDIHHYHISLDGAHTVLARACLTVLLQLDRKTDKKCVAALPLAFYAARHWVHHAKYEGATPRVQGAMERLFNPSEPYLASLVWIHDVDQYWVLHSIDNLKKYPSPPEATALYYAVLCGFSDLANYLIVTHAEDASANCGSRGTPLLAAAFMGHLDATRVLLDHGANLHLTKSKTSAVLWTASRGHVEIMRLLLEHGTNPEILEDGPLHIASCCGQADDLQLLLQHKADVNSKDSESRTPLHCASTVGHVNVVQLLLEHGAEVNALTKTHDTPMYLASLHGRFDVVRLLLGHKADVHFRGQDCLTPYQIAKLRGHTEVGRLLVEHGADKTRRGWKA